MFPLIFSLSLILSSVSSVWVPESGADWSMLKPDSLPPRGSFSSLPYDFGIVVKAYDKSLNYISRPAPGGPGHHREAGHGKEGSAHKEPLVGDESPAHIPQAGRKYEDPSSIQPRRQYRRSEGVQLQASNYVACAQESTLSVTLENGVLRDVQGRIGLIVASNQFQFDGPPPQHGALYAAGWLVTAAGYLALGNSTTFYQCKLGTHYNLYNTAIAFQCSPVALEIVELTIC